MGLEASQQTSTRDIPDEAIARAAPEFFQKLRDTSAAKNLTFNLDEFAVLMGSNRKWSWHPAKHVGGVSVRETKEVFTACCCLSSAAGELVELQVVWKGKTSGVHALPAEAHAKIFQDHQPTSHFQTADTFSRLVDRIVGYVAAKRAWLNTPDAPAVLIVDAAPQHSDVSALATANISVVDIPKSQTHVFQPADQFIIACIKQKVNLAWDKFVEKTFADNETAAAIAELMVTSRKVVRRRMYSFLADAVDQLTVNCIVASWEVTGIPRAMWSDMPVRQILVDAVMERVMGDCECGNRTPWICDHCEEHVCSGCRMDHRGVVCTAL